jgi:hypothetical protein
MKWIIVAILAVSPTREITAVTSGQAYGQTSYQSVYMYLPVARVFVFPFFAWVGENSVEYTESSERSCLYKPGA